MQKYILQLDGCSLEQLNILWVISCLCDKHLQLGSSNHTIVW